MDNTKEKWDSVLTRGPPAWVLCFGINVYKNRTVLDNFETDAEVITERVRDLSDSVEVTRIVL
jgi:hypothetical protein